MFDFCEEFQKLEEEIKNFRVPRVADLPDIELYMDQVIKVITNCLSPLEIEEKKNSFITPSMINNYVKLNVVPAPVNKKYSAIHVCYLIAVCILKHIFSINDIKVFIAVSEQTSVEDKIRRYNLLCDEIERALETIFSQHVVELPRNDEPVPDSLVAYSIAGKVYCELIIDLKKRMLQEKKEISYEVLYEKAHITTNKSER